MNTNIKLKRLYQNRVDVRDYVAKRAIQDKVDLTIVTDERPGEKMILTPEDLQNNIVSTREVKGSLSGDNYKIYSYKWKTAV